METSSPSSPIGSSPAKTSPRRPVTRLARYGVRNLRMDLAEHRRQQAVLRHRVEDARLAEEHDENHRGQAGDRADLHDGPEPRETRARRVDADRDRVGHVELGVLDDAREHERHRDVEHGADGERAEDADRHVALRILGLLRRGGDRVESDVGEEDHAGAAHDPVPAVLARAGRRGDEGLPVLPVDVGDAASR